MIEDNAASTGSVYYKSARRKGKNGAKKRLGSIPRLLQFFEQQAQSKVVALYLSETNTIHTLHGNRDIDPVILRNRHKGVDERGDVMGLLAPVHETPSLEIYQSSEMILLLLHHSTSLLQRGG